MEDWLIALRGLGWGSAGNIALAALLGGLIGLERDWSGHPAGLRTNMLVAIGSCLFTILSIEAFPLRGAAQDTARIAAQIVTGIGFLGAGALIQSRSGVRGMTTAATIWLVAAIGMAVGTQTYFLAIFTTLLSTVVLVVLHPLSSWLEQRARQRKGRHDSEPNPNDPVLQRKVVANDRVKLRDPSQDA